jgi:hypothetical protein
MPEVGFVFFNLSGHEIKVESISGLSDGPPVGHLAPAQNDSLDNRLETVTSTFLDPVHVEDQIKIIWQEGGTAREAVLKRNESGLPAQLKNGKVRFTYLGDSKWRVRLFEQSRP